LDQNEIALSLASATHSIASEHLTIYTGVLAHIALVYPEPTLFFFAPTYAALIHYGTLLFMAIRRNREAELHTKGDPIFGWYIATPPFAKF